MCSLYCCTTSWSQRQHGVLSPPMRTGRMAGLADSLHPWLRGHIGDWNPDRQMQLYSMCTRTKFRHRCTHSGNNANTRGRKTQQGVERKYFSAFGSALCNRSKRLRCSLTPTIFGEQDTQKTYVAATCGRVPLPWCKTTMAHPGNDVTSLKLQRASSAAFRHIAVLSSNQHDNL